MLCYLQPSGEASDQLEVKWKVNRQNADCKPAIECALDLLKSEIPDGTVLLQTLVPLLYAHPYLSRFIVQA